MILQQARTASVLVMAGALLAGLGPGCGRDQLNDISGSVGGSGGRIDGGLKDGGAGGFKLPFDAAGIDTAGIVACAMCTMRNETCCVGFDGQPTCVPAAQTCSGSIASVSCVSPLTCPGEVCCLSASTGLSAACAPAERCATLPLAAVVCMSDGDCPSTAPHCCALASMLSFCRAATCGGSPFTLPDGGLPGSRG